MPGNTTGKVMDILWSKGVRIREKYDIRNNPELDLYSSDTTAFKKQMKDQATQCQSKMYSVTDKAKLKCAPFIESDLQDFTVVALNVLCADPYNGYQRISGLGSLCNVIFYAPFSDLDK